MYLAVDRLCKELSQARGILDILYHLINLLYNHIIDYYNFCIVQESEVTLSSCIFNRKLVSIKK